MGSADFSDQMKVTYEVGGRSKFCFYLCVFFDFLDIAVINSKITYTYNKIESAPSLSSLDFRYSLVLFTHSLTDASKVALVELNYTMNQFAEKKFS